MSTKAKSIFSGMGGLIGALAGIVTVIVGVVTIGSQTGWFGTESSGKSTDPSGSQTTEEGGQPGSAATGSGTQGGSGSGAAARPRFEVSPSTVDFKLISAKQATITVKNTGTVPFSFDEPIVQGSDAFDVDDVSCTDGPLARGASCEVRISAPTETGNHEGTLQLPLSGTDDEVEVTLSSSLL